MTPDPRQSEVPHPTVEACVMRSFCDATFDAAERRVKRVDYLLAHIHGNEHDGPMEGCPSCFVLFERADSCHHDAHRKGGGAHEYVGDSGR